MREFTRRLLPALVCSLFAAGAAPQPAPPQRKPLTLDILFDPAKKADFTGVIPIGLKWLQDGRSYLERQVDGRPPLVRVQALTGERAPLFPPQKVLDGLRALTGFTEAEARKALYEGLLTLGPDEKSLLINHNHDLYHYRFGEGDVRRLTRTPEAELEVEYSPDSRMIAFVRGHNLFAVDLQSGLERQLTFDGSDTLLNGLLDWVYQEEIYGRGEFQGYWWSPDSSRIAYLQLDERDVPRFPLINDLPVDADLETAFYPQAGDPNPRARLGVVKMAGGGTQWVDLSRYARFEFLIVRVGWTPDSRYLVSQVQNREQTWLDLNFHDSEGAMRTLLREGASGQAWVDVLGEPVWLPEGGFLWLSERSGWSHLYHYSSGGELLKQLTSGEWEVRKLLGTDARFAYFTGTRDGPVNLPVYRLALETGEIVRLTPSEGTHRPDFNSDFSLFLDSWDTIAHPRKVYLYNSDGDLVRMIAAEEPAGLREYQLIPPEFVQVKARDGFALEAFLIKPPDFDPARTYPVLQYTYAGPGAQAVADRWGGNHYLWHQFMAQNGYLIWILDNRSASGKGAVSRWPVHRNLGRRELEDLEDGLAWLRQQPYVDSARIGLWGWSYGGYMTSYALTHSSGYRVGIAGAPVTDWRLYDSIYTERYMGLPQDNPQGYRESSAVESAASLNGKLLLIHGTIDDNVHLQNTVQLAHQLQQAGKPFELMIYPDTRHHISKPALLKHFYSLMTDFIRENL